MKVDQQRFRRIVGILFTIAGLALFLWYWLCIAPLLGYSLLHLAPVPQHPVQRVSAHTRTCAIRTLLVPRFR